MLFIDFQDEVKRRILKDQADASIDPFVKRWVNTAVRTVRGEARWKDFRGQESISTVDGTEDYVLPYDYDSIAFVWHRIMGYNYRMSPMPERLFVDGGFIGTTEGNPYWYRLFSTSGMLAQPSAASVVDIVSSSASDTTPKIRIEGLVSGYPDAETKILTGETKVTTTKIFSRIDRVTKDITTIGRITVSVTIAAVTTTIGVLPTGLGTNTLRRKWIKFYYIPDTTGDTIYVNYYRKIFAMVDDNDTTPFSDDFDEAIALKACQIGLGFEEGNLPKAKLVWLDYKDEIRRLKKNNLKDDDWTPMLASFAKNAGLGRVLNFGSYYPRVRY